MDNNISPIDLSLPNNRFPGNQNQTTIHHSGNLDFQSYLEHGLRPARRNGTKRKGVDDYVAEHQEDLAAVTIFENRPPVKVLFCRCCSQTVGARADRIKEHLASRRHLKNKSEASKTHDNQFGVPHLSRPIKMNKNSTDRLMRELKQLTAEGNYNSFALLNVSTTNEPQFSQNPSSPSPFIITPAAPPQTKPVSMEPKTYRILWANYDSSKMVMFCKFLAQENFVDVTLWCEKKTIKCHKIILSSCSKYFEELLTKTPNVPSIIFLSELKFTEVQAIIDFMYKGEVVVREDRLPHFAQACDALQVNFKGLI